LKWGREMDTNSLEYQKSIAIEFNAIKNRIRHLIGSTHWGEEGRYKEIILINFLKKFLPSNLEVGTGFIKKGNATSSQIDIIIYNPSIPLYFKENDFVIVQPGSVLGIIEVKSDPDRNKIGDAIIKANKIDELMTMDPIFNGLFIFGETKISNNKKSPKLAKEPSNGRLKESLLDGLSKRNGINHIVSNDGVFIKKWIDKKEYVCYGINELAASYFFSNLLDIINQRKEFSGITQFMYEHLYPIPKGKGEFVKWRIPTESNN
jgi:hypothetical protein